MSMTRSLRACPDCSEELPEGGQANVDYSSITSRFRPTLLSQEPSRTYHYPNGSAGPIGYLSIRVLANPTGCGDPVIS